MSHCAHVYSHWSEIHAGSTKIIFHAFLFMTFVAENEEVVAALQVNGIAMTGRYLA